MSRTIADIWEGFAQRDPAFYILARRGTSDVLLESGRREVRRIVSALGPQLARRRLAIDVGCGIGRLTVPLAAEFERVLAVDVAPTMLHRLRETCAEAGVTNVVPMLATGPWEREEADLVVSCLTLQHVDQVGEIAASIHRVSRCLAPGGLAWVQVDSRRRTPLYALRNRLPDFVLPALWRRGIRRIRRPASTYGALFERVHLAVVTERNAGTERHVFVLRSIIASDPDV